MLRFSKNLKIKFRDFEPKWGKILTLTLISSFLNTRVQKHRRDFCVITLSDAPMKSKPSRIRKRLGGILRNHGYRTENTPSARSHNAPTMPQGTKPDPPCGQARSRLPCRSDARRKNESVLTKTYFLNNEANRKSIWAVGSIPPES